MLSPARDSRLSGWCEEVDSGLLSTGDGQPSATLRALHTGITQELLNISKGKGRVAPVFGQMYEYTLYICTYVYNTMRTPMA